MVITMGTYGLPKALVFESVLYVHTNSVPWSPQHWTSPSLLRFPIHMTRATIWTPCHHVNLLLLRYVTNIPLLSQLPSPPAPLSYYHTRLAKAKPQRIQIPDFYMLREEIIQPGSLEPLSTADQCELASVLPDHLFPTVKDGSRNA